MTKKTNNLAMGIVIATDFDRLFQTRKVKSISQVVVETGHALSMHGVGIVLGIVGLAPLPADSFCSNGYVAALLRIGEPLLRTGLDGMGFPNNAK